jgi:hypothetical protein
MGDSVNDTFLIVVFVIIWIIIASCAYSIISTLAVPVAIIIGLLMISYIIASRNKDTNNPEEQFVINTGPNINKEPKTRQEKMNDFLNSTRGEYGRFKVDCPSCGKKGIIEENKKYNLNKWKQMNCHDNYYEHGKCDTIQLYDDSFFKKNTMFGIKSYDDY